MKSIATIVLATTILGLPTLAIAGEGWTGFYLGAHVGPTDAEVTFVGSTESDSSTAYGLQAGYNHSLSNNWVIGGELSYGTAKHSIGGDPPWDSDSIRLKFKTGYDLGTTLVYGILGYVNIDDGLDSEDGTTFGIGINYKATDTIILGGEILRDSVNFFGSDLDVTSLLFSVAYQF
ncbi:porin family protein [Parasedimentitalea psychrophila]|uniref:Porin family protein n=1 Tax=Parasedimentitalea psychrophila TaxID=2997337 RepID=A0A9Y2L269_9RHOB|nr:porin family protein [Parasedimentitalea psychrophila]WIY27341.1 porin family protein [Parasedimentitalea psychrophila]